MFFYKIYYIIITDCIFFAKIRNLLNNKYTNCKEGGEMKSDNIYLIELKSYWFDNQYYNEIKTDSEIVVKEIQKLELSLKDREVKGYDTFITKLRINNLNEKKVSLDTLLQSIIKGTKKVETVIDSMHQPYKNILFLKYIKNLSFDEIAYKMNYSSKRIYQLHKIGVDLYIKQYKDLMISKN